MIIRDQRRRQPFYRLLMVLLPVALIGVIVFLLLPDTPEDHFATYTCDAEEVSETGGAKFFIGDDGVEFGEGMHQSDIKSRSGKYSCEPTDKIPWGMTLILKDLTPGERYEIKVWRNSGVGKGDLVIEPSWGSVTNGKPSGKSEGDWEELVHEIEIPYYARGSQFKVYVLRSGPKKVWFDDLSIERIPGNTREELALLPAEEVRTVNLVIEDLEWRKLEAKRQEALERGLLVTEKDDWVKARLEEGEDHFKAKVRLKGDWTDHLAGDKWSFRVALKEGGAWNGMTTFSLQNPATRSHLQEWFFHRWLQYEGLLAPRYDLVQLKINGESKGIYAYEEHFMKQLPESNDRREGPILKFVEDGLWEAEEKSSKFEFPDMEERIPRFISSEVAPFGESKILKDTALLQQFQIARDLMHAYKHYQKSPSEIFDLEKMAKYYALVDVCQAHHAFIWHNQRFYYNPVISRLEPIGYDGFTSDGPLNWVKKPFVGYAQNFRYMSPPYRMELFDRLFNDTEFVEAYVRHLYRLTDINYLMDLQGALYDEIEVREKLLQKEWIDYQYDYNHASRQAKAIRLVMQPLRKSSVKVYKGKFADGKQAYQVYNYHCLPVRLLGVGDKSEKITPFTTDTLLPSYVQNFPPEMTTLYAEEQGEFLYFEVPGMKGPFEVDILPWEAPGYMTPEQELFSGLEIKSNELYQVDEEKKEVTIGPGVIQTEKDILIPPGYTVKGMAGTEIDLLKGAKFISKSKVVFDGQEELPILVHSSDGTGMGFTVLQLPDGEKSEFHYTVFENLNTLAYKGWNLTGAVTFYEAEVVFHHCRFVKAKCEDALNIIRSLFTLSHCYVGYSFSDGFDADFCTGSVNNCYFSHTGNDAMDFSGGNIYVGSAFIDAAGDKGISFGEESEGTVIHARITDSRMGVASKDLSQVRVESLELKSVQEGLTVYQKKPEYGPGNLEVVKLEDVDVERLHRVQVGSTLIIEGNQVEGKW